MATFDGRFRVDHGLTAREALIAGRGISPVPRWLVDDLLGTGCLKVVMPDFLPPSVPLNMLVLPERSKVARVRLLEDYLIKGIATMPVLT